MEYKKHGKTIRQIISMPIIWSLLPFLIMLDIVVEFYHQTCFRLYDIPLVKRKNYIKIDRHKLKYLTWYEKIGCMYCGYTNGVLYYMSIIASKTEKYWCGIMHKKHEGFQSPEHHREFVKYGDEEEFKKRYSKIKNLKKLK